MPDPIGLIAFWKNYDRKLYLRAAELADDLGYDSFWLPEAWGYEIFSILAEAATRTKRIKLGTGIVNVFSRTPGLVAMSAATVDEISGGRFILGIGTSGKKVIEGFHGRPFEKPLTRVRDVIRVTRALLSGKKLSDAGPDFEARPFRLEMKPVRPDIPIYVAALRQKAIEQIGEIADGAGKDMARQIVSFYIGGMGDYYIELLTRFGFAEECKKIAALYKDKTTRAEAAGAVTNRMIEALTITGSPSECLEELRRRRAFGVDLPVLNLPTGMPWEVVEQFIRAMAPR